MAVIEFGIDLETVLEHIKLAQEEGANIDFFINGISIASLNLTNMILFDKEEPVEFMMQGDADYLISYLTDFLDDGGSENLEDVRVKGIKVGYEVGNDEVVFFESEEDEETKNSMFKNEQFIELSDVLEDMKNNNVNGNLVFENPNSSDDEDLEEPEKLEE